MIDLLPTPKGKVAVRNIKGKIDLFKHLKSRFNTNRKFLLGVFTRKIEFNGVLLAL